MTLSPEADKLNNETSLADYMTETQDTYTEEQQAADAELYNVAEKTAANPEAILTDNYTLQNGSKVEIRGKVYASYEGPMEDGKLKVEIPVTITDPNALGEFKDTGRYSKFVLIVDKASGEAKVASRVDRMPDEKRGGYNENGPTYKLSSENVAAILNTSSVYKALHS
jgi:hypothetical protein